MGVNTNRVSRSSKPSKESGVPADSSAGATSGELDSASSASGGIPSSASGGANIGDRGTASSARRGDRKRSEAEESEAEITIETPPVIEPKKRQYKRKVKAAKPITSGAESASAAIGTVEIFAIARFGPEAKFSEEERQLIEPSLAALIEQYGDTISRYGGLLSVIPLVAGVISYTSRLAKIAAAQTDQSAPPPPPPAATPTVNGSTPSLFNMETIHNDDSTP